MQCAAGVRQQENAERVEWDAEGVLHVCPGDVEDAAGDRHDEENEIGDQQQGAWSFDVFELVIVECFILVARKWL